MTENELRFKNLFENMAQGVVYHDAAGKVILANASAYRILGLAPDQLHGKCFNSPLWKAIREDGTPLDGKDHPVMTVLQTGKSAQAVMGVYNHGEEDFHWLSVYAVPLFRPGEKEPCQVLSTFEDVTRLKLQADATRKVAEQYRIITENMQDVVWILDVETLYFRYMSPSVERLRGYTPDEVMALPLSAAVTKEYAATLEEAVKSGAEAFRKGERASDYFRSTEVEQPCKDGRTIWTEAITRYYRNPETGRIELHGVTREIEARKKAELALRASLDEKDLLMRELQHRVKNNLNMVNSLLSLESMNLTDEKAKAVFQNARARIQTMSGLYERLYRSKEINLLDLDLYLREFVDSIKETYVADPGRLTFEQDLDQMKLDLKRAVPLCLILNELLSNAVKYAYPDNGRGPVRIALKKTRPAEAVLSVMDEGRGFPEGFDALRADSMGLTLVRLLADQLGGRLEIVSAPGKGVSAQVFFPFS